ncbi:lactate utilization protein C [Saccharicrinis sp. FJH54]|uniref:LutC/YkgG family protein n=1 Tax=Saccharicrinis sp. FJH54 TaxID=3344665 RepID=UPI0035D4F8E8
MTSRDAILSRIRRIATGDDLFDIIEPEWKKDELVPVDEDLTSEFQKQIEKVSGICYKIDSPDQLAEKIEFHVKEEDIDGVACSSEIISSITGIQYKASADNEDAFVVPCEALIASTGSVLVSAVSGGNRRNHVFPPVLFVIASNSQLVPYLKQGIEVLKSKYNKLPSMVSLITGPSRTADIEKTLVLGAHGPKKLIVFLLPENEMFLNHSKQA